eukprot:211587-Rhodomonas_salina.1
MRERERPAGTGAHRVQFWALNEEATSASAWLGGDVQSVGLRAASHTSGPDTDAKGNHTWRVSSDLQPVLKWFGQERMLPIAAASSPPESPPAQPVADGEGSCLASLFSVSGLSRVSGGEFSG